MGHVVYHHDDSEILEDFFNFTSKVKGLHLDVSVPVKVYLESHQKPPRVIHNNPVVVEQGKPVKINKEILQVSFALLKSFSDNLVMKCRLLSV